MKLNIFGPINSLGYGVVTRNLSIALSKKIEISLNPVYGNFMPETEAEGNILKSLLGVFDLKSPSILIWHQGETQIFAGTPRIAMPIFELTEFTKLESLMLRQVDYIATMSHWGKEVLLNNNINEYDNIFVIPGGVDITKFNPAVKPSPRYYMSDVFTFISAGKLEIRKGHKEVLAAFSKAFENSKDKVRLLLHWESPFGHLTVNNRVLSTAEVVKSTLTQKYGFVEVTEGIYEKNNMIVEYVGRLPSATEVAELYACADVGVFPYRAEGWNLPLIEMLATNYSGPTEFLRESFSWLLDYTMINAVDPQWFPHGVGQWANININDLINYMIRAKQDSKEREIKGRKASEFICHNFTWDHSALSCHSHAGKNIA